MRGKPNTNTEKFSLSESQWDVLHENCKIAFWTPWPQQQRILSFLQQGKKVLLLQGANRVGKTVCGVNICGSAVYGQFPWTGEPTPWGTRPVKVRIICVDWEHHAKEVIIPTLREWLPRDTYKTLKNTVGAEAHWQFPNGSSIELMTQKEDTRIHEGWKGDLVWSDEPLPKDKFVANRRGLLDNSGVFLLTMTAIYEPWIMDDIALSPDQGSNGHIGCVTEVPMTANPLLKAEDIENYEKDVTPEQREARINGGWFQLAGKVIKGFDDKNIIDDFETPPDWPMVAVIDLHLSTEQAVGFYAWDKYDRMFVCDEIWEHIAPEQIADKIIVFKNTKGVRLTDAYIDPLSKGDSAYVKNRFNIEDSFSIIEKKLNAYGIRLHVGSKDKQSGVRNIQERVVGANKVPSLFIQRRCKRHLYEIMRWVYDEKGLPRKENDHMMENLYRATLTGTKYSDPGAWSKKLKYKPTGVV